jgi:hypothetical protein
MEFNKVVSTAQSLFGALITCLAVYTFMNIDNYSEFPLRTQLYMIWTLVSLCLLMYGTIQLSHGIIEMFKEE